MSNTYKLADTIHFKGIQWRGTNFDQIQKFGKEVGVEFRMSKFSDKILAMGFKISCSVELNSWMVSISIGEVSVFNDSDFNKIFSKSTEDGQS